MIFREALESDAEALALLVTVLGYPTSGQEMKPRLRSLADASHKTIVAEIDGEIAGFIGLCTMAVYESSTPIGYILALSVSTAFQRKGMGRALIGKAEEWFQAQGIGDVRVGSGLHRPEAHLFYERCGFIKTGYRFRKTIG